MPGDDFRDLIIGWAEMVRKEDRMAVMKPCSACEREPVPVAVVVPADQSHTGETRVAVVPIDACIADLVRRLNAGAVEPVTCGACCGHGRGTGEILLADGRTLMIRREEER